MFTKSRVVLGFGALLLGTGIGYADVVTQWQRLYGTPPSEAVFSDVAVANDGSVYAAGRIFKGGDNDALFVRYGPGGSLYWAIKFTGTSQQVGKKIVVCSDGSQVFAALDTGTFKTSLIRLSPGSGVVLWSLHQQVPPSSIYSSSGLYLDETASPKRVFWPVAYHYFSGNALDCFVVNDYGGMQAGVSFPVPTSNSILLDLAGRPDGGVYYLIGNDPALEPPNSEIWAYNHDGARMTVMPDEFATCLASTGSSGGQLFAVGGYLGNHISLSRYRTDTNANMDIADNVLTGVDDIDILDVAADSYGGVFVAGYETVPFFGKEPFLARFSSSDLGRTWRLPRPATTNDDRFSHVKVDSYGNIGAVKHRNGVVNTLTIQLFDGLTGTMLGESALTSTGSMSGFNALSSNLDGIYAGAGMLLDGTYKGLLLSVGQRGIKRVSVPQTSYVGGSVVPCTVSMYGTFSGARSVALASTSALAPVPPTLSIPSSLASVAFNITTGRTSADTLARITATYEGIARTTTFTVLAPRPSNLTFTPGTVIGGQSSVGQVNLTGLAPIGGLIANLSSNKPEVTVPATATVLAGNGFRTFTVATSVVSTTVVATVSATANGTTKTRTLTVNP